MRSIYENFKKRSNPRRKLLCLDYGAFRRPSSQNLIQQAGSFSAGSSEAAIAVKPTRDIYNAGNFGLPDFLVGSHRLNAA